MTWLDAPTWVHTRLTDGLPGVQVTSETDATIDTPPCLVWALTMANPDPLGIWTGNLTLTLLCPPADAPGHLDAIYDLVGGWRTPGPLHDVELISYTAVPGARSERLGRYVFVYSLTWDL